MPKVEGQKLKIIRIKEILEQKTDKDHALSMSEITAELAKYGIPAERKGIYRDINALRECGMNIETYKGKNFRYYLANREFDLTELRLLIDAVYASKFIPVRAGNRLIKKLSSLTNKYNAEGLQHKLYAEKESYTATGNILTNIEKIYNAIDENLKIGFKYYRYTMHKKKEFRHNGKSYITSPWAMVWNDGRYYLLGYDSEMKKIKHYRVDKMTEITNIDGSERDGSQSFEDFDIKRYTRRIFSMYSGQVSEVKMKCHKSLADVIIDKFGMSHVVMKPINKEEFIAKVEVEVSPMFISWIMGFGNKLEVTEPKYVREQVRDTIKTLSEVYKDEG